MLGQVYFPLAFVRLGERTRVVFARVESNLRSRRDDLEAPGQRLQWHVRPFAAIEPPVLLVIERGQPVGIVWAELAVGQLHHYLVPLASVSHLAAPSYLDLGLPDARGAP